METWATFSVFDPRKPVYRQANNLAGLYYEQGEYAKAEAVYSQTLEIWKDSGRSMKPTSHRLRNRTATRVNQPHSLVRRPIPLADACVWPLDLP
jgi:hypothetical protein